MAVTGWRPSRPGLAPGTRALFNFGANLTGFSIVDFFARNSDNILIGRVWGESDLGLYDRAFKRLLESVLLLSYPGLIFEVVTHDQLVLG